MQNDNNTENSVNNDNNTNPIVEKTLNFLKKFISFEHFITPTIVTFIFWIVTACVILSGLYSIIAVSFIFGVIELILGVLFTKIFCEMLMVLFKINESLKEIAKNTKK